jgi:hypothetical protein
MINKACFGGIEDCFGRNLWYGADKEGVTPQHLQFQPLSVWIMILGLLVRVESLIPAEAECRRRARFAGEPVLPRGQSMPAVISLPMDIIERGAEADWKLLQTESV